MTSKSKAKDLNISLTYTANVIGHFLYTIKNPKVPASIGCSGESGLFFKEADYQNFALECR